MTQSDNSQKITYIWFKKAHTHTHRKRNPKKTLTRKNTNLDQNETFYPYTCTELNLLQQSNGRKYMKNMNRVFHDMCKLLEPCGKTSTLISEFKTIESFYFQLYKQEKTLLDLKQET